MKVSGRLHLTTTQAILAGIFLVGLALRLFSLDLRGLWRDEVLTLQVTQRGIEGIFNYRFGWPGNQTPFYYLTVWLTGLPIDPAATTLLVRLPSALAGASAPLVVFAALGRELFGLWQGLLAALLMALSTVSLSYSQDLRPYAMVLFLTVTSVYSLVKAERAQSRRWWLAFTVSTVANLLNAYIVLTMVLPALAPYLTWVLWRAWSERSRRPKQLRYALGSFAAIGLTAIFTLAQLLQTPKTSEVSGQFSIIDSLITAIGLVPWLLQWFTRSGVSGGLELGLQRFFIVLSCVGVYNALRGGRARSAILCLLFIVIGPLVFAAALASEKYAIGQRYALFAMPFYFLLLSNGFFLRIPSNQVSSNVGFRASKLYCIARSNSQLPNPKSQTPRGAEGEGNTPTWAANAFRGVAVAFIGVTVAFFAWGTYNYLSEGNSYELTYRPDFRGVSRYLAGRARPDDTIVFVTWDSAVSNFYWGAQSRPRGTFSALDPRLFSRKAREARKAQGDIYWVVSYDGVAPARGMQRWEEVAYFQQVAVLREKSAAADISRSMEQFVSRLRGTSTNDPGFERTLRLLSGCIAQARGDVAQAAAIYKQVGEYSPVGSESLLTAYGFAQYGDIYEAWQDALRAKADQPGSIELHRWLAQRLSEEGWSAEGQTEKQLADLLQSMR